MTRPAVTPLTDRLYGRLPEYLRVADGQESSGGGYPLLRYLSAVVDQGGAVAETIERIDYLPPGERPSPPPLRTIVGDLDDLVPSTGAGLFGVPPSGPYMHLDAVGEFATHTAYLASGRWRIDIQGFRSSSRGIGEVRLDGEPIGTFDSYAVAVEYPVTLFSYENDVNLGFHEVRISHTDSRNTVSTDSAISVYGVTFTQITSTGEDTSDLVDPTAADAAWLPWLGRLVGVNVSPGLSTLEKRDAVAFATSGFRAGTKEAIAAAARSALTGTKHAEVYDHSIFQPGDGGLWDILLITRRSETPDIAAVLKAVVAKNAKPAGAVLHHRAYDAPWDTVEATYPTWAAIEAAGSWNRIQEAGL